MTATSISALLGMTDLATEYGYALVTQVHNQRVADGAAYAGALAYASAGTTSAMQSAALALAALNGVPNADTAASLTSSPRGDGSSAVEANVTTPDTIVLSGRVLNVTGLSYVELSGGSPPCILALSTTGTGVTLSGGTNVSAASCAVASNTSEQVPCGTTITSDIVEWDTTAPTVGCGGITPYSKASATLRQVKTNDPFASNAAIQTDVSRLATVATQSGPAAPSASGGNPISFGYSTPLPMGNACTASFSSPTWTVTCPAGGSYNFGSMTVGGGLTVNFDTGHTNSTYSFSGTVNNGGNALHFGSGTFNLAGGLTTGGGSTTSFGSGTLSVGKLSSSCGDGAIYSICNTSTLTVSGPVTLNLQAGFYNSGGSTLSIGAGSTANAYQLGAGSSGYAISVGGGSFTTLGDATSGVFQATGSILAGSGGECLTLPAATQHDIYGNITTAGGLTMGAGVYTVTGYVDIGGSGGGDVSCNGSNVGVSAANTTFVIGAAHTPSDNCSGDAFCIGSGFNHVTITAPTSGTNAALAIIGPTGGITAGASVTDGASNTTMSGLFYFPDGPLSLGGGASISGGGQCLELVATQITLSGGSATATTCPGLSGNGTTSVASLVQ